MGARIAQLAVVPRDDSVVTYSVRQVPIDRIRAFAFQPRQWFDAEEISARAESMRALGQQDPVTVEPVTGDPEHDYELINGESRLRSAREAGLTTLWAAVRSVPFASRTDKHLASLVANFNRSDHTPMEISNALHIQVTEGGRSQAEIARALGKPESWVGRYLSLQRLHPELQAVMHPARPRAERLAPATAFELARLSLDEQTEILWRSRDAEGRVVVLRVKVRAMQKSGAKLNAEPLTTWTLERTRRHQEHHRLDPRHVARLRAWIEEFRRLLARRR